MVRKLLAFAAVLSFVACGTGRSGAGPQRAETTTAALSSTTLRSGSGDYDTATLVADLGRRGRHVRPLQANVAGPQPLGAVPARLCIDGRDEFSIYQYSSAAERSARSAGISADGYEIGNGASTAIVEWVLPPRFYARGRVIVLYLGADLSIATLLGDLLGATVSPSSPVGRVTPKVPPACSA